MRITVNGQPCEVPEGTTLKALVELLALKGDRIACERNLEVVPRAKYAETKLADGDKLEIVTFVGGG
ncbi:MAG: thiamine biosynthesis protein ThiS [Planctomycetota bacterium]|nr:thiamine biosynthesis protein ThiS [Planctomycetota bacterium]GIK51035.1 MAG: thiamine biosynthesis protein ThiS [Planctomycetota bacterium]